MDYDSKPINFYMGWIFRLFLLHILVERRLHFSGPGETRDLNRKAIQAK